MRRRLAWAVIVSIVVLVVVVLVAGVTDAFGTGTQVQANVGGWFPDGAAPDTFWDSSFVDVPGVSVTAVHCHSRVQLELQLGATGPSHDNPCYAAMGLYSNSGGSQWGVYITLPQDTAVYRISEDYKPWRYCVAGLIFAGNGPEVNPAFVGPTNPC
jgi:hypothetical protein